MLEPAFGLALAEQTTEIASLARAYGPWIGIRSNHVINQGTHFAGPDGSSRSISTPEDRELLLTLRRQADLIIVDAQTARLEKYRSPSSGAKLAVFSKTGDFSEIPAVESPTNQVFTFSTAQKIAKNSELVSHTKIGPEPFSAFADWARELGFVSILLEAGPKLTRVAFEAKIVSQSAVTFTPRLEESIPDEIGNPFDVTARLLSLAHSENASFTLWQH
jgi:riboflavin biosynthesis pyrimidine reductase